MKIYLGLTVLAVLSGCFLISSGLPECDSDETRDLIEDIYNKNYKEDFAFKKTACIGVRDNKPFIAEANSVDVGCGNVKIRYFDAIAFGKKVAIDSGGSLYGLSVAEEVVQNQKIVKSIVYIDDFKTTFESFLVKSDKKSEDGNSKKCLIRYDLKTVSDELGKEWTERQDILLTIYKKDDNGERDYEYRWE